MGALDRMKTAAGASAPAAATRTTLPAMPAVTSVSATGSGALARMGQATAQRVATQTSKPASSPATEWADGRAWDRQISIGSGPVETPKISTLPFTGEPPALQLLSATAATNQQEGRYRPTAISTTKQTKKQSSLATERADEADKMMAPSESRQRQQALATERADEADKMLVPSASRQAAQSAITSSTKSQEGRSRPVAPAVRQITQEEWAAQQRDALTQKINDAQTKLDAANARYADVARYGTVEDRIALRTEIRDLEQQIRGLKKERGDPNLLERIEKTLSGTAKLYGAQFLGIDEWLSNVEQNYQEWKEDAGIPSGGYKDGPGGRVWGEEPTAESARKQAEYVQNLGSNLKESGAADVERAKEGLDGVGRTLVDVGVAGTQMLGDVGLGIVTGGGSMLPMMLRSFGGGVQEAREKGYDVAQQTGLGLASAATEYFTERLFNGNPAYDKDGLINKLVERVAGDGKLVSVLSSVPAEIISEGLEEVIADILEPISEKVLTGNWTGYDVEQIIHDGIVGMALGGLGQGGQYIAGKARGAIGQNGAVKIAEIKERFAADLDQWLNTTTEEQRALDGGRFLIGHTSENLQKANVDDYDIYFGKSKIARILRNPEMTPQQIKSVADVVDAPIIVMDSKTVPGSITLFGDSKTANGKPVMVSMLLHPTTKTGEILDYGVVTSAYGRRKSNAQNLINSSNVRYIDPDEKRTGDWMKALGLQLPSASSIAGVNSTNPTPDDAAKAVPQMYAQDVKIDADNNIILPQSKVNAKNTVKTGKADASSYADAAREMHHPGARQSASYTDDLAHVNELLQNAALSPRDQAYIQEDIADAQRSCDAAMKVIVNPGTTAEERAQAVRRAIDALDYARQRINDLGLPATQLGVSTAQGVLADLSEKLKPYLLEESAPLQVEWTDEIKPATIDAEAALDFSAKGEDFVRQIVDNPKLFGTFDTPDDLKLALENAGFEVKPLGDGQLKGVPFEDGGGYRINFSDGGVIMYHPEERSHHGGAYYKISTGKGGTRRYDRYGKELRRKNH